LPIRTRKPRRVHSCNHSLLNQHHLHRANIFRTNQLCDSRDSPRIGAAYALRRDAMRIGIPIWNGRVSPLLDTAQRLTVVDSGVTGSDVRHDVPLAPPPLSHRAAQIAALDLDLLVCGAVSRRLAGMLETSGVSVSAWVAGDAEEVLRAVSSGELDRPRFEMPGCCRGRGGRGRRAQGRGPAREPRGPEGQGRGQRRGQGAGRGRGRDATRSGRQDGGRNA